MEQDQEDWDRLLVEEEDFVHREFLQHQYMPKHQWWDKHPCIRE